MKRIKTVIIVLALGLPLMSMAQTDVDLDPELGGRLGFGVDKKLARGLHVSLQEELRFDNNFASFNRFHTTLGVDYKVNSFLKVGMGYALINGYDSDSSAFKDARHRLFFNITGTYRAGDWQFSLKERIQMTHRTGTFNEYQNPTNAWTLKSRLKVTYKGLDRWEPYGYLEIRNTLNAPVISAVYNETTGKWGYYSDGTFTRKGDAGWFLDGFKGAYVNRVRLALGTNWKINKQNVVDLHVILDYVNDKVVDANSEGTKLKSYTRESGFVGQLCASYEYRF